MTCASRVPSAVDIFISQVVCVCAHIVVGQQLSCDGFSIVRALLHRFYAILPVLMTFSRS